ncbi:hypothetical protein ACHQM5_010058 [Ranunculus cassubicifolius]
MSCAYRGKAIKASERLAISAFLWCISATAFTSPTVSPVICTKRRLNYTYTHKNTWKIRRKKSQKEEEQCFP